jgi:integrase/recombinase XerD
LAQKARGEKSSKNAGSEGGGTLHSLMKTRISISDRKEPPQRARLALVPPHAAGADPLAALDVLNPAKRYLNTLSSSSRRAMRTCLDRVAGLLHSRLDHFPWERLRADHVRAIAAALTDAGRAPATVNVTLAALRGVARQAFEMRAMEPDQYRLIARVGNVRGCRLKAATSALDLREVGALLDACAADSSPAGKRDACLLSLLAGAGLRRAEAAQLRLADWRARTHCLRVRGKGNKERLVYLEDGGTRRALLDWLRVRGMEPGALLVPVDGKGRLADRGLTAQAVYNAVAKRRLEAGIRRRFSPHDLRHFFASEAVSEGGDLKAVSDLLGHASVQTTQLYVHGGERAKRQAAALVRIPYRTGGGRRRRKRKRRRWRSK